MSSDEQEQFHIPEFYELPCGAKKSSIMHSIYEISDGTHRKERPFGIKYSLGIKPEHWLSGEALVFPTDRAVCLIVGRAAELKLDMDLVPIRDFLDEYKETEPRLAAIIGVLHQTIEEVKEEPLLELVDIGDLRISRHHLQLAYHPEGVLTATYDPSLGLKAEGYPKSARINFPLLLNNYGHKPSVQELNWILFGGSRTVDDREVIIINGSKRVICLRFFKKTDLRPAMVIKQSYPVDTTVEQLHQGLILATQS